MRKHLIVLLAVVATASLAACGSASRAPVPGGSGDAAGVSGASGDDASAGGSGGSGTVPRDAAAATGADARNETDGGTAETNSADRVAMSDGSATSPSFDDVKRWAEAYKAAHPGNGGKDWDINAKTPAQIAADPAAQALLAVCGKDQRPVIPLIAWEYGGSDHSWINPAASALVYCVYTPIKPSSPHWQYDAAKDHVTADIYLPYPEQNPCKGQAGPAQVLGCLGDPTNVEILVDTASINDGADVGLTLANSSTDLTLIQPDGSKIHLYTGL